MCTQQQCQGHIGKWVQFNTRWGRHQGVVQEVNNQAVLIRVPRQYAPNGLASCAVNGAESDEQKLDLALVGGYPGFYGGGYPGGGYPGYYGAGYPGGGYPAYGIGRPWGRPGYGAWYGGWWWWWLAFA